MDRTILEVEASFEKGSVDAFFQEYAAGNRIHTWGLKNMNPLLHNATTSKLFNIWQLELVSSLNFLVLACAACCLIFEYKTDNGADKEESHTKGERGLGARAADFSHRPRYIYI